VTARRWPCRLNVVAARRRAIWRRTFSRCATFPRRPSTWKTFSETNIPFEVEVGTGRGLFLVNAGTTCPGTNFLGVEYDFKEARRAARRLQKRELANVRILGGDANVVLPRCLPDACAQALHVYFPDPWWKRRHKRRRIFNPEFLNQAARILQPGGLLHAWTDVEEYFAGYDGARGWQCCLLAVAGSGRTASFARHGLSHQFRAQETQTRADHFSGQVDPPGADGVLIMNTAVQIGRSYKEWWFVGLAALAVSLLAGGGMLFAVKHQAALAVSMAGAIVAFSLCMSAFVIARSRFQVEVQPAGFLIRDRLGEREFSDDQVICASFSSRPITSMACSTRRTARLTSGPTGPTVRNASN